MNNLRSKMVVALLIAGMIPAMLQMSFSRAAESNRPTDSVTIEATFPTQGPTESAPTDPSEPTDETEPATVPTTEPVTVPTTEPATEPETQPTTEPIIQPGLDEVMITVIMPNGTRTLMKLEDYLVGVTLAEMPGGFQLEALKAQAVAARTFTVSITGFVNKHDGAVCTNPGCCQAYISESEYYAKGGFAQYWQKSQMAVQQTSDWIMTYGGKPIQAAYFSCSGGHTENSRDIFGVDMPYLVAVPSPGEEWTDVYSVTTVYTANQLAARLGRTISGDSSTWLGQVNRTAGGGVSLISIAGRSYTGAEIQKMLGLRTTLFTITESGGVFTVVTKGFGHRVGMSQYGAQTMAMGGATCWQILTHYYTGITIDKASNFM